MKARAAVGGMVDAGGVGRSGALGFGGGGGADAGLDVGALTGCVSRTVDSTGMTGCSGDLASGLGGVLGAIGAELVVLVLMSFPLEVAGVMPVVLVVGSASISGLEPSSGLLDALTNDEAFPEILWKKAENRFLFFFSTVPIMGTLSSRTDDLLLSSKL